MGLLEKLKTPAKIVLSFIFGILCGKLLLTQYETVTFKPWSWEKPPVVLNCYGPMLRPAYIERSVQYWEDLGEKVLFVELFVCFSLNAKLINAPKFMLFV